MLNLESHSGITYGVTATNPEMAMCTDVINYLNLNTDRPVGWHPTLVLASCTVHTTLNMLYRTKNSKQLWKVVGNTRKDLNDCSKTLSIDVLEQYFEQKFFGSSRVITDEMVQAQDRIDAKLKQQLINTEQVTSNRVRRLIKQLKLNASPAQDGITAEHLICFGQSNYQSLVLHADLVHTIWCGA